MSNETRKFAGLGTLRAFLNSCKNIFATKEQLNNKADKQDLSNYETKLDANTKYENAIVYTDNVISQKADKVHAHDEIYYTETEIDTKLSSKSDVEHNHDSKYDAKGTASSVTSIHNTNTEAHDDIRILINDITTRLNALANSTDIELDQMAELVDYIKTNRDLIEGVTTNKVNVSDIINNLTTNVSNQPLSAAQGVAIKELIDSLQEYAEGKAEQEHTHVVSEITNLQGELDNKANAVNVAYIDENDNETEIFDIVYDILSPNMLPVVPIEKGGTGSTNVKTARANLGVPSVEEMNAMFNSLKTENWTFMLEDGSTVTKEVYVG